jgi:lysozyme family protein
MADADWDACLAFVFDAEGGYTDDPADPGGATNFGITLATLSAWRGKTVDKDDVRTLGQDEAGAIYRANYWNATRCSDLPVGVDMMVFDAAVNTGNGRAARMLQQVVGAAQDGSIGPQTLKSVSAMPADEVVGALAQLRTVFYHGLPGFPRFGGGWLARVNRAQQAALKMVADM